jgi:hypothetical protein
MPRRESGRMDRRPVFDCLLVERRELLVASHVRRR